LSRLGPNSRDTERLGFKETGEKENGGNKRREERERDQHEWGVLPVKQANREQKHTEG